MHAASGGHLEIVKYLVESCGCSPFVQCEVSDKLNKYHILIHFPSCSERPYCTYVGLYMETIFSYRIL